MARRLVVVTALVLAGLVLAGPGLEVHTQAGTSATRFARRHLHLEMLEAPVPQLDALGLEDSDETSSSNRASEGHLPGHGHVDAAAPVSISTHGLLALSSSTQPLIYRLCKLLI